jgi:hypothetical protein
MGGYQKTSRKNGGQTLALGELEPSAGSGLTVLLTFHHPGVPGKKTVTTEAGIISLVYLAERPGKSVAARAGLTIYPAAVHVNQNIEFILAGGNHQGLANHHGMLPLGKILV